MDGILGEIYNYLLKVTKLDDATYSKLISIYGEENVNKVIEYMIENQSFCTVSKFDSYISKVTELDDVDLTDLFGVYSVDFGAIPCLSKEENQKLINDIFMIIAKLNTLFVEIGYNDSELFNRGHWIEDRAKICLSLCNDKNKLVELNTLFSEYIKKRNTLIEGNLRLVISVAKKYHWNSSMFNEFIQYGNMGLIKAVEKYDPSFNTSFSTYAYYWIKQSIMRNMPSVCYSMSISHNTISSYVNMKKAVSRLTDELGREPIDEEIADEMGISVDKVVIIRTTFREMYSLDDNFGLGDNDSQDNSSIYDYIEDEKADVSEIVFSREIAAKLNYILDTYFDDKQRLVIKSRFGLIDGEEHTLEEIGNQLNLSRERIRQIEKRVKCRLKSICEREGLSFY